MDRCDAVVIGTGHNGLVAALLLARAGLSVRVYEEKPVMGGATRTEKPFKRAPNLAASTGSYLLGLMPPELIAKLGVDIPVLKRDPHYFLPTTGKGYLLFGSDKAQMREQFVSFFSEADWKANEAMQAEIAKLREDIAPTWMEAPLSIHDTAEKYVRPALRTAFIELCKKPASTYISRFGFKSDLVKAMYVVTDGFSGLYGGWDSPGTGMNFLIHNMCRLPDSDGTWMVVKGGMGTVSDRIAEQAKKEGASIEIGRGVKKIVREGSITKGVILKDGTEIRADVVVCNADPFRMRDLVGADGLPADYNKRLDNYRRDGTTMKVNLALKGLPKFTCLPADRGQPAGRPGATGFGPTIHLLPNEKDVIRTLRESWTAVEQGALPEFPSIEWYIHTAVDPSLQDDAGNHSSALFVQSVPYELKGTTWEKEEAGYVKKLLAICDRFAPGTSDLVVDAFALHPQKIEEHFGITRGHIHHVDNSFGFADRVPYATPLQGLYSASAACHPAGAVIGAAGHNAAMRVLKDMGKS